MRAEASMFPKSTPVSRVKTLDKIPCFGSLDDSPRGRVLRAAAYLFRMQGYSATTVREIAALVGIQSGSLFHHFRSKEEILFVAMRETIIYNIDVLRAATVGIETPEARLRALIMSELNAINGITRDAMTVLVFEWESVSRESREALMGYRNAYEQMWLEVIHELQIKGVINDSPRVRRSLLRGAIAWTATWFRKDGSLTLDELADVVWKMALGAGVVA